MKNPLANSDSEVKVFSDEEAKKIGNDKPLLPCGSKLEDAYGAFLEKPDSVFSGNGVLRDWKVKKIQ